MSALTKFITRAPETIFPEGRFQEIRATAPNQGIYNIEATRDLVKNQPAIFSPFAPAAAATMSIPYDMTQGIMRARDKFFDANPTSFGITDDTEVPIGPSLSDVAAAIDAENPISSAIERTKGATLGLADRLVRAPEFLSNLIFSPLGADSDIVPTKPKDDLMNYDEFYDMPEEKKREGILSKFNPMKALGFLANIATGGSLSNALTTTGLGTLFSKIAEAGRNTPNYQYRTPGYEGRLIASDFYDPKTGLNRFDRAKTLFGQSRTMKDFLDALKEQRDRRAANRAAVQRAIQNQQDAGGSVQSSDDYSGVGDQGATGANFSGDFATDSASYDL